VIRRDAFANILFLLIGIFKKNTCTCMSFFFARAVKKKVARAVKYGYKSAQLHSEPASQTLLLPRVHTAGVSSKKDEPI
jgi:hypothetical protein